MKLKSFISKYYYLWSFDQKKEREYLEFVKPSNLNSLRLVTGITLFGFTVFSLIDYFRDVEFSVVVLVRSFILAGALIILLTTYLRSVSVRFIQWAIAFIAFMNFGSSMVTATFARMPAYYLTNLLFLIFVLVVTASGLRFRHALLLNIVCLIVFILFSQFIRRDPFYFSQYPHAIAQLIYILIVGVVLEKRRRDNFIQFCDLIEQKKMVDELNEQKSKIISILSHDIGAPINSLAGLVNSQISGIISVDEAKPHLEKLNNQIGNTTNLLSSLVRWSHSQLDGFVSEKKRIDLESIFDEMETLFQSQLSGKNLQLKIDTNPMIFETDEDMLRISIRNLVSNAIKFAMPETTIHIQSKLENEEIQIRISNEGKPILKEEADKLFTYKMPSSQGTAGERGTGLGLAMTAYFIQFNNGRISLESAPGSAITTFRVQWPVNGNRGLDGKDIELHSLSPL